MLNRYSHHSGDVMFTWSTLLTITETQICGEDDDLASSKLTRLSYSGKHLSRLLWPHAITLPLALLKHNIPHNLLLLWWGRLHAVYWHFLEVPPWQQVPPIKPQILIDSCRLGIYLWCPQVLQSEATCDALLPILPDRSKHSSVSHHRNASRSENLLYVKASVQLVTSLLLAASLSNIADSMALLLGGRVTLTAW